MTTVPPGVFPFGQPSTPRPPRKPAGAAKAMVIGVYPSALHVRWTPPAWARDQLGLGVVGALAVDDEPMVFWDGSDAEARVQKWHDEVGFKSGDSAGDWGHARAAGNGTSGLRVVARVLQPLGLDPSDVWFTDVVDRYFVKSGGKRRDQAGAIEAGYQPFAESLGIARASLPPRPSVSNLVALAVEHHAERLRSEIAEASPPLVLTLGEEARRVVAQIADGVSGLPSLPLDSRRLAGSEAESYGESGILRLGKHRAQWRALVHPGQRSQVWSALHDAWIERRLAPA